jgi:hypothetical protein
VIYNSLAAVQAIAWILTTGTALRHGLARDEKAAARVREGFRRGLGGLAVYSLLAVAAAWFPVTIVVLTTLLWTYWLIFSLRGE